MTWDFALLCVYLLIISFTLGSVLGFGREVIQAWKKRK